MASASNSFANVFARFLIAVPFLVHTAWCCFMLFDKMKPENAAYALEQVKPWKGALQRLLGREQAADIPDDRLLLVLLVTQGLGAFLMVMNHRFGGALLLLYLLPATALLYPFWEVDPERGPLAEYAVLSEFLRNVAIMGGVIGFMITTDQVPLKVKRKHLHPDLHQHRD